MDDITYYDIRDVLENKKITESVIFFLTQRDLLNSIIANTLPTFKEAKISFEPSYRRNTKTGLIQLSKTSILRQNYRLPGYADRVLLSTDRIIEKSEYKSLEFIQGSDHLPVSYLFQVENLRIVIITWNVASGNPNKLSPTQLEKIDFCRNTSDILIIAFQEVHNINFEPILWSQYYNSHICIFGKCLNKYIGYGIDTYIFWNNDNISITQNYSKYEGSLTKGYQLISLRVVKYIKYEKNIFNLLLSNTHAPFTNSISKYESFFRSLYKDMSSFKDSDILCIFGDLNSRSLLKINKRDNEILIKNIRSPKEPPQKPDEVVRILNLNLRNWKKFKKFCGKNGIRQLPSFSKNDTFDT